MKNKPKINQFIICNEFKEIANEVGGKTVLVVDPFQSINFRGLPSYFSFSILIGIVNIDFNSNNSQSLKVTLSSPSDKKIAVLDAEFSKDLWEQLSAQMSNGFGKIVNGFGDVQLNFEMRNLEFSEQGVHKITTQLNNELLGENYIVANLIEVN